MTLSYAVGTSGAIAAIAAAVDHAQGYPRAGVCADTGLPDDAVTLSYSQFFPHPTRPEVAYVLDDVIHSFVEAMVTSAEPFSDLALVAMVTELDASWFPLRGG